MPKILIVDDQDQVIGAAERAEARQKGWIHRIARVIVVDSNGRVLLQKRSEQMEDSPGKWDFSAAGHVDEGEDYLQAAAREAEEELGLRDLTLTPLKKSYTHRERHGNQIRRFNVLFGAKTDQVIQIDPEEVAQVEWFTIDHITQWVADRPEDFTTAFVESYSDFSMQIATLP